MCLAIPGKILEITAQLDEIFRTAKVSFGGIAKEVKPVYDTRSKSWGLCNGSRRRSHQRSG